MSKRFVREEDRVYWAELAPTDKRTFRYQVHNGYYLASYKCADDTINLVSLGKISSCVVRHLKDYEIFNTPELAQKRADELNTVEERL